MQDFLPKKIFIVEGNIGAGKSTLLRLISENLPVALLYEPVDEWKAVGGQENLLEKFYADIKRWAYTFQTYAFVSRIKKQQEMIARSSASIIIAERSVFSDRYCFAKNCFEQGLMTALEWQLYQEWFSWLVDTYTQKPDGFIYLRVQPEQCYVRTAKRDRFEESSVQLEYLTQLHAKHEQWLIDKDIDRVDLKQVPVLVLDCQKEFEHDLNVQGELLYQISNFCGINAEPFYQKAPQNYSSL